MTTESISPTDALVFHLASLPVADLKMIVTSAARFTLANPESLVTAALAPLATWLLRDEPRGPLVAPAGLTAQQLRAAAWSIRGAGDDLLQAEPGAIETVIALKLYAETLTSWASRKATLN